VFQDSVSLLYELTAEVIPHEIYDKNMGLIHSGCTVCKRDDFQIPIMKHTVPLQGKPLHLQWIMSTSVYVQKADNLFT